MLTLYADHLAGTDARLLVERFSGPPHEAESFSLLLTSVAGLDLVQLSGISRPMLELLGKGIGEVLTAAPETAGKPT